MRFRIARSIIFLSTLLPGTSQAQEVVADTTAPGYQVGYTIGAWLPFVVLAALFIIMLRAVLRKQSDAPNL